MCWARALRLQVLCSILFRISLERFDRVRRIIYLSERPDGGPFRGIVVVSFDFHSSEPSVKRQAFDLRFPMRWHDGRTMVCRCPDADFDSFAIASVRFAERRRSMGEPFTAFRIQTKNSINLLFYEFSCALDVCGCICRGHILSALHVGQIEKLSSTQSNE